MLRFGVVFKLDSGCSRVQVRFDADDNLESTWLPVLQRRTLRDKFYGMPDIGEHVACMMDGDDGVVLGAIYSVADPVPQGATDTTEITEYSDGTRIQYNAESRELTAVVQGNVSVESKGDAVIKAEKIFIGNGTIELLDQIVQLLGALINSVVPTISGPQKLSETFVNFPLIKAKLELLKKPAAAPGDIT